MTTREIECPECDWLSPDERAQILPFLAAALGERGTRVAGELEVLKQSGISLLLRGRESNGAAFYLKVVPPTFRQEPALTAALGARSTARSSGSCPKPRRAARRSAPPYRTSYSAASARYARPCRPKRASLRAALCTRLWCTVIFMLAT
jgi:hypothetical protein